jgi:hypothetical protein
MGSSSFGVGEVVGGKVVMVIAGRRLNEMGVEGSE